MIRTCIFVSEYIQGMQRAKTIFKTVSAYIATDRVLDILVKYNLEDFIYICIFIVSLKDVLACTVMSTGSCDVGEYFASYDTCRPVEPSISASACPLSTTDPPPGDVPICMNMYGDTWYIRTGKF